MTKVDESSVRAVLARQERRGYARSPLFLAGVLILGVVLVLGVVQDDGTSSTMSMIGPAALIGLVGMVVMAGLVRRSDRAAVAAGAVSVGEQERTRALASAVVVPVTAALVWFVAAVVQYWAQPPAPWAVPFGELGHAHVLAVMFALTVVPAAGGPILGLVLARWLPRRATVVVGLVVTVLITILLQGNFESTWRWHVVWPWTYWYGPLGWSTVDTGGTYWVALPGSPFAWIGYLVALCVLGVLVALYHDREADRARLAKQIVVVLVVAVVALALTMLTGLDEPIRNALPGPSF